MSEERGLFDLHEFDECFYTFKSWL